MAKFAKLTYGTKGESGQYTYIVNDSVRVGQYLNPAVTHPKSGKVYGTTGIVQSTSKNTDYAGDIKTALSAGETGVKQERTLKGAFAETGLPSKPIKSEDGIYRAPEGKLYENAIYRTAKTSQCSNSKRHIRFLYTKI
jgi:hypothetical protein